MKQFRCIFSEFGSCLLVQKRCWPTGLNMLLQRFSATDHHSISTLQLPKCRLIWWQYFKIVSTNSYEVKKVKFTANRQVICLPHRSIFFMLGSKWSPGRQCSTVQGRVSRRSTNRARSTFLAILRFYEVTATYKMLLRVWQFVIQYYVCLNKRILKGGKLAQRVGKVDRTEYIILPYDYSRQLNSNA